MSDNKDNKDTLVDAGDTKKDVIEYSSITGKEKGFSRKKNKAKKRKTFIKPMKEEFVWWDCLLYGVKVFFTGLGALISIPLTYLGALTGILIWILVIGLIGGGVVYTKVYPEFEHCREVAYDTLSKMQESDFSMLTDTEIYDSDGNRVGLINAGHYEYADITEISDKIQNGYIAVEDKRFKTHIGFDWISTARAALALVKNQGEITQGGSTITQQVIKNAYLTQEKTFTRKITEILLAPEVEKKFSKADIMEFYCNTNFYGHRCYGVEAASKYYFGKKASDVEWWEAALLIGLSNSPSKYDPIENPEDAIEKRNRILKTICDEGYFDEEKLEEYQSKPLNIVQEYTEGTLENYQTSYAIHCAALELMKNDGFNFKYTFESQEEYLEYQDKYNNKYNEMSEKIRSGGYKIYTTLDSNLQSMAQEILDKNLSNYTEKQENGKYALQGSAVIVDNQTNNVVAIIGGRGSDDLFNRGYLAIRQPGSTIKPIIDYAPAFETGEYYPSKVINDHKWEDGPSNAGSYYGNVTVREALNRSLNTVAWQVLQGVGVENGLSYLGKMQFMNLTFVDNSAEAVSIGGFTKGTRVVDMAKAYSTLANNGLYSDKTCIRSIIHEKDGEIYNNEENKVQVYSEDTAYMTTDILKGTMDVGYATGYGLDIPGQEAAGKTGTTNSNKDTWYCGYTRYYTTAVWVGYDTPRAMPGVFGATYSGRIWNQIMTNLHDGLDRWDWERPISIVDGFYNPSNGKRVAENTGLTDIFSTKAETRAEELRIEKERENYNKFVEEQVSLFEQYSIITVEDTFDVDQRYQDTMSYIALVVDDVTRGEFGNRAATKYQELNKTVDDMNDVINEYYRQIDEAVRLEEEARIAEEERLRQEENLKLRKQAFEYRLQLVNNLGYAPDNLTQMLDDVLYELSKLVDMDDYEDMLAQYEAAKAYTETLPDMISWSEAEAERKRQEEEQMRLEDEQQLLIDEQRRQEIQGMRDALNSQPEIDPSAGPGQTAPVDNSWYGPGNPM